jgi:hypothetical protein
MKAGKKTIDEHKTGDEPHKLLIGRGENSKPLETLLLPCVDHHLLLNGIVRINNPLRQQCTRGFGHSITTFAVHPVLPLDA